jgi:hypothetical protein
MERFWVLAFDPLSPPDAIQLAEALGIDARTSRAELERGSLCGPAAHASKRRWPMAHHALSLSLFSHLVVLLLLPVISLLDRAHTYTE